MPPASASCELVCGSTGQDAGLDGLTLTEHYARQFTGIGILIQHDAGTFLETLGRPFVESAA